MITNDSTHNLSRADSANTLLLNPPEKLFLSKKRFFSEGTTENVFLSIVRIPALTKDLRVQYTNEVKNSNE